MARFEQVELANICLVHTGDRYLLQNRVANDWRAVLR